MVNYQQIENLVLDLKNQEEKAYSYLYDNYSEALYGIIFKIVDNEEDANDVLQEAFINIWRSISTYDPKKGGTLFTWILNIARNKAIDRYRQKNRQFQNQSAHKSVSIHNERIQHHSLKVETIGVKGILNQMKPELKEMIDLHYFKGYTHQEITELTQLPLGTVKTKIRSAMGELKKVFGIS
jgi:RNA polymerase sigma factor (sigma-70 family)